MKLRIVVIFMVLLAFPSVLIAGGDAVVGKDKSSSCASCHGTSGEGIGENPKIAGMDTKQFSQALQNYKSGAKKHMMMEMMTKNLSDQDIADLAAFYATQ